MLRHYSSPDLDGSLFKEQMTLCIHLQLVTLSSFFENQGVSMCYGQTEIKKSAIFKVNF